MLQTDEAIALSNETQQIISLGVGGVLITLVGYSIWKLIGGWMSFAGNERTSSEVARAKAEVLQERLSDEIAKRVALEVEVRFLKIEIEELRARLENLEHHKKDEE